LQIHANDEQLPEEAIFSKETHANLRTTLNLASNSYDSVNDEGDKVQNVSTSNFIRVTLNNIGEAVILISPNHLISESLKTSIRNNAKIFYSNALYSNEESKHIGEFKEVKPLNYCNQTSTPFDTYKYNRTIIRYMPDYRSSSVQPATDDMNVSNQTFKIQIIKGKMLSFMLNKNASFNNPTVSYIINTNRDCYATHEFPLNRPMMYTVTGNDLGNIKYTPNGFNNDRTPPYNLAHKTELQTILSNKTIKYSEQYLGSSDYKIADNDVNCRPHNINFGYTMYNKNLTKDSLIDTNCNNNDKLIRILIKGNAFQIIEFRIESFFVVRNNEGSTSNDEPTEVHLDPIVPKSHFEKDFSKITNAIQNQNRTMDGAELTEGMNNQNFNFFTLWNKVKRVGSSILGGAKKVVGVAAKILPVVDSIINPEPPKEAQPD
jgi:hypothetical protein